MSVVLVPIDGSEASERALARGAEAARELGLPVLVLQVVPTALSSDVSGLDATSDDAEYEFARGCVDKGLEILRNLGASGEGMVIRGAPIQVIREQIEAMKPALVVIGARAQDGVMPEGSMPAKLRDWAPRLEVVE